MITSKCTSWKTYWTDFIPQMIATRAAINYETQKIEITQYSNLTTILDQITAPWLILKKKISQIRQNLLP